jgi:hypothetical protein
MDAWYPVVFLVFIVLIALSLVPLGRSGRSVADRVSPRSAANTKNNNLG